jgi:SapC
MPNGEAAQHMVCVQQDRLSPQGQPLFDAQGAPTAAWAPILQLLEAIENARQQTRVLCRRLEALELLTPFDAVAIPRAGEKLRLQGLFRVDEEKLQQIPGRDLRTLMKKGELRAVYAHLLSLENFARLLDYAQEAR